MRVEEEYMDVLQSIECAVTTEFEIYPDLTDYAVQRVYENLIDYYSAEVRNRPPKPQSLDEKEQIIYTEVKKFCDWHLGRNNDLFTSDSDEKVPIPTPITPAQMVTCLKRLVKSLQKWTRHHGRQGYLKFISMFIP